MAQTGFGTYSTYTTHQAYNDCNGVYMPPYSNGWSGIVTQALAVTKPYIAGGSNVWLQFYGANANSQSYYNYTLFKAYTGGAPEVPTWTFTGATQMVSTSCYQCFTVQITATPQASPACTTQVFGQFKVGNLTSSQVGIMLRGPVQQVGYYNGLHVNNTAAYQNRGYDSFWNWQINDSCGLKMDGANMHESFPQGFTFDYAAKGWGTPTANSWTTGNTGLWSDGINEWYPAGTVICPQANYTLCPIMLPPQNPLGSTVIYHGLQYVYVGNNPGTLVFSGKQAHFQDHGGYIP